MVISHIRQGLFIVPSFHVHGKAWKSDFKGPMGFNDPVNEIESWPVSMIGIHGSPHQPMIQSLIYRRLVIHWEPKSPQAIPIYDILFFQLIIFFNNEIDNPDDFRGVIKIIINFILLVREITNSQNYQDYQFHYLKTSLSSFLTILRELLKVMISFLLRVVEIIN